MKLLIADDHTLFRDALVQYIERAMGNVEVVVTKDFHEAYDCLKEDQNYALVLLDLRMPGMDGMGGFRRARDEFPEVKIALMSGVAEKEDVDAAFGLGAVAYFPKTLSGKALVKGIEKVLSGEIFMPIDEQSKNIMPSYYNDKKSVDFEYSGAADKKNVSIAKTDFNLTPREKQVLEHLALGISNKEIANALNLQVVTIKLHVRGICRKLGANNRTQAALKASECGLVKASFSSVHS